MFCCPTLDGAFRCLPKAGGYYDQDYVDMAFFRIIDRRLNEIRKREASKG